MTEQDVKEIRQLLAEVRKCVQELKELMIVIRDGAETLSKPS